MEKRVAQRLRRLPRAVVVGREVPVAADLRSRLLGLAWLDRAKAGAGLLIPRCSSVHTFGMRFALDLYFLDSEGTVIAAHHRIPARRVLFCRAAAAVLEVPSAKGGEFSAART